MLANLAAACMVLVVAYVQWSIPGYAVDAGHARLTRAALVVLGAALGLVATGYANIRDASAIAVFLIAFGHVHVPMAIALVWRHPRRRIPS